jgi:putative oxidoreductase
MSMLVAIIGRILLGALFIISGLQKIAAPGATAGYIESVTTLPGSLALPTGIFELVAGALLALGLMSRLVSIVLAVFTALTIFFFHNAFTDLEQGTQALKNVALIGGLLMVFAYGQMRWNYDHLKTERRGARATHEAELRAHEAELAAARAEGRASVAGSTVAGDYNGDGVPDVQQRRSAWWRY